MKIHELKILPEFFSDVEREIKKFEIRLNDRDFKVGDLAVLREWDGAAYTGQIITKKIVYVFTDERFGLQPGYCIFCW